jgi:hypothetical protein
MRHMASDFRLTLSFELNTCSTQAREKARVQWSQDDFTDCHDKFCGQANCDLQCKNNFTMSSGRIEGAGQCQLEIHSPLVISHRFGSRDSPLLSASRAYMPSSQSIVLAFSVNTPRFLSAVAVQPMHAWLLAPHVLVLCSSQIQDELCNQTLADQVISESPTPWQVVLASLFYNGKGNPVNPLVV